MKFKLKKDLHDVLNEKFEEWLLFSKNGEKFDCYPSSEISGKTLFAAFSTLCRIIEDYDEEDKKVLHGCMELQFYKMMRSLKNTNRKTTNLH